MDENKLEFNLNEIKFKLLNKSECSAENIETLDRTLSYIIQNNLENKYASSLHSIIFILDAYKEILPLFTLLLLDLIQKKLVFNDLSKNTQTVLSSKSAQPVQDANCLNPGLVNQYKPGEVYKMINKQGNSKEIITYRVNGEGQSEEIDREIYVEPDIDNFFNNILGSEINEDEQNLKADDL